MQQTKQEGQDAAEISRQPVQEDLAELPFQINSKFSLQRRQYRHVLLLHLISLCTVS